MILTFETNARIQCQIFFIKIKFYNLRFFVLFCQVELIDPALKGTFNVLRSCVKVPSIKRVVITSSMAAVAFNGKPLAPDVIIDESWFSDPAVCEKSKVCIEVVFCGCFTDLFVKTNKKFTEYELNLFAFIHKNCVR